MALTNADGVFVSNSIHGLIFKIGFHILIFNLKQKRIFEL